MTQTIKAEKPPAPIVINIIVAADATRESLAADARRAIDANTAPAGKRR